MISDRKRGKFAMKKKYVFILVLIIVISGAFFFMKDGSAPEITTIEFSERTPKLPGVSDDHFKLNKDQVSAFKIKKSDNIKGMKVNLYELKDSEWEPVVSSEYSLDDSRTDYTFFSGFDGESGAYQEILKARETYAATHTLETAEEDSSKLYINHIYSIKEAPAGAEVPVLAYIFSSNESKPVVHFERFDEPEVFNRIRADKIYIITVTFTIRLPEN